MTHGLIVNIAINSGVFTAFWRRSDFDPRRLGSFDTYRRIAVRAEEEKAHAVFTADSLAFEPEEIVTSPASNVFLYEPTSYLGALAASTRRIGLLGTWSTTFTEPYGLARQLVSLDHLSGGRVGWNIVTSTAPGAAGRFGRDRLPDSPERYRRAEEHLAAVRLLWGSFGREVQIYDRDSGIVHDLSQIRDVDFRGETLSVRGALNQPHPPQEFPVLCYPAVSEAGQRFAARHADIAFNNHESVTESRRQRHLVRTLAESHGRDPDGVKTVHGLRTVIAPSREEAEAHHGRLLADGSPQRLAETIAQLLDSADDLDQAAVDRRLALLREADDPRLRTARAIAAVVRLSGASNIRQLSQLLVRPDSSAVVRGTAADVADYVEDAFRSGAVDGFSFGFADLSKYGVWAVLDRLLPELRRRGVLRGEYRGATYREDLGLPQPRVQRTHERSAR